MVESIQGIIDAIDTVQTRVRTRQPNAVELHAIAGEVAAAARLAEKRIRGMRSAFSLPRVRLYVMIVTVLLLGSAIYSEHFASQKVTVHVTASEFDLLQDRSRRSGVRTLQFITASGSSSALQALRNATVDAAVVQGGVELAAGAGENEPRFYERLGKVHQQHLLYLRKPDNKPHQGEVVLTFARGEGSELIARRFYKQWGRTAEFRNDWAAFCAGAAVDLNQFDAIFVIVDMAYRPMQQCLSRAHHKGFRLTSASVGAYEAHLEYLSYHTIRPGFLSVDPEIPEESRKTYLVTDYLYARPGLTTQQRADLTTALAVRPTAGDNPLDPRDPSSAGAGTEVLPYLLEHSPGAVPAYLFELLGRLFHSEGNALSADLADLFEAVVNLALIMAALFGLEVILHRRYIQELSSLLTHISQIQADHDVVGVSDRDQRRQNMMFLEACSDLLGLVSSIAGYYSQGNAALAFNGLTGFVHVRANLLKLNIQLKLVQAVQLSATESQAQQSQTKES